MYVAALEAPLSRRKIHILWKAQIAAFKQNKAFFKVPTKYLDFSDIFSKKKYFSAIKTNKAQ